MKRSESGGEGSSSKRIREDVRRESQEGNSSSPGSGNSGHSSGSGPYPGRGRGYHSSGEGRGGNGGSRDSEQLHRDQQRSEGGDLKDGSRDRGSEKGRPHLERRDSNDGSDRGDRGRPHLERRDSNDGSDRGDRGRPPFERRDSNGGSDRGGDRERHYEPRDSFGDRRGDRDDGRGGPSLEPRDSLGDRRGDRDDGRGGPSLERRDSFGRGFDRGGRGGGRPPFTGRGGPGPSRGDRGEGRGRGGGRGRGARRDYKAEELARHDLVVSNKDNTISKSGSKGKECVLLSNYFVVTKRPDWCIFHYRVDFSPDEERTFIKKQLMKPHKERLGAHIFDGASLYVCTELPPEVLELYSYGANEEKVRVTIRKVADVSPTDVMYIQVLNIILRSCLSQMGLEEMGRNFFDARLAKRLEQRRLELWPGYKTTIRHHEKDILLGVEMTHKVLRLDNCLTVINSHRNTRSRNPNEFQWDVQKDIVGSIVMTHYNRKTYRIDDIDWNQTPLSTFKSNDTSISFADYMSSRYQVQIKDFGQPLLVSRPKKRDMHRGMTGPILLIPELCQMTGLTDRMRGDHTFMKDVNQYLLLDPQDRISAIKDFINKLTKSPALAAEQAKWGLKFNTSLVQVNGRFLPDELITLGKEIKVPASRGEWTQDMKDKPMKETIKLVDWVVIASNRDKQHVDSIVTMLKRVAQTQHFSISQPKEIKLMGNAFTQDYFNAINEVVKNHKNLQLIFALLPQHRVDTYTTIKKRCCIDFAIPSQCFQVKHANGRNLMSVCTKVVVQMNAKLGGQPWNVAKLPDSLMVVGFDVYHCGKRKGDSMGATVSTTNATCSKFFSTVSAHTSKDELSNSLCTDITKCLHVYKTLNDKLPGKIVMYRDGVGEGQLSYVYNTELEQIKLAIKIVYGDAEAPKIAFIVVTKKINTRLFHSEMVGGGRRVAINPPQGTVVDNVVTLPERYDFFLTSQSVRQGTVSPTAYNVLEDTLKYPPDRMQKLTYMMTHMYYNSSSTVAVPGVCQYAHKLAYLSGAILKSPADERLSDRLYYL